jgi:hypothetical protein
MRTMVRHSERHTRTSGPKHLLDWHIADPHHRDHFFQGYLYRLPTTSRAIFKNFSRLFHGEGPPKVLIFKNVVTTTRSPYRHSHNRATINFAIATAKFGLCPTSEVFDGITESLLRD